MARASVNNAARALEGIIARWHKDNNGSLATGGTSTAYTLTLNQSSVAAWYDGLTFAARITDTCGATPTINPTGSGALGAKSLYWAGSGVQLAAGDLVATSVAQFCYEATSDKVYVYAASGRGLVGALGSTDNAVLRADGAGGLTAQGSVATIADTTGNLTIVGVGTHASLIQGSGTFVSWTLDRTDTHGDNTLVSIYEGKGRDSDGNAQVYGRMNVRAVLDNAGAETGGIEWQTGNAGSVTDRLALRLGLYTPNATSGDMGADSINASSYYENGRRVFPAGCWGYVTYSGGTPTLVDSGNVTSIGDGGTGDLDVTIATDHANATYAVLALHGQATHGNASMEDSDNKAVSAFTILVSNYSASAVDPVSINFATFGDI